MPDLKISQLPVATTPLAGTELVPIVQGGTTDQTTVQAILTGTVPSGTANGVAYLNGSKVLTTGSALTFDGTNLGVGGAVNAIAGYTSINISGGASGSFTDYKVNGTLEARILALPTDFRIQNITNGSVSFYTNSAEQMRLTSTGLGIGTSSPAFALGSGLEVERAGIATLRLENSSGGNGIEIAADSTTNGIRFYGLNNAPFVFAPNATEAARITSGGDLLVGTTSALLSAANRGNITLNGASTSVLVLGTGNAATTYFYNDGTNADFWNAQNGFVRFGTNNTERARITSGGDLLVGATSTVDAAKLYVVGTISNAGTQFNFRPGTSTQYEFVNRVGAGFDFYVNNAATLAARITATGSFVAGAQAALATTATDGFLYVPTCAGTPTGTPTAITGMAPIVVNTTNNKLYFYSGGAWRDAGP